MTNFHDAAARADFSAEKMRKVNLFESKNMFCDVYCLEPGQAQKPHAHADADKIYTGLTGTVRVTVGDETKDVGPGQVAVAPAGAEHGVVNAGDARATLLVVMAPHPSFGG